MSNKTKTAILFFSRSAGCESHSKQWTNDENLNVRIARKLITDTRSKLEQTPYPVFFVDETLQSGATFGEKLSNAFKFVFKQGYSFVFAVGNDCPELNIESFQVPDDLRSCSAVFGPDMRGGAYMIGISQDSGYEAKFKKISWNGNRVFEQLTTLFSKNYILEIKRDINSFDDITQCEILFSWITAQIQKPNYGIIADRVFTFFYRKLFRLRAPPFYADFT